MITNRPCDAAIPACRAAPYPRCATRTTRAPCDSAISMEPSVEPLSATITSPQRPADLNAPIALSTQMAREFASFKQGITTETSTSCVCAIVSTSNPIVAQVLVAQTSVCGGYIWVLALAYRKTQRKAHRLKVCATKFLRAAFLQNSIYPRQFLAAASQNKIALAAISFRVGSTIVRRCAARSESWSPAHLLYSIVAAPNHLRKPGAPISKM